MKLVREYIDVHIRVFGIVKLACGSQIPIGSTKQAHPRADWIINQLLCKVRRWVSSLCVSWRSERRKSAHVRKSVGPQLEKKRPSWQIFPNKAIESAPYSPDETLNATTQIRQLYYEIHPCSHPIRIFGVVKFTCGSQIPIGSTKQAHPASIGLLISYYVHSADGFRRHV